MGSNQVSKLTIPENMIKDPLTLLHKVHHETPRKKKNALCIGSRVLTFPGKICQTKNLVFFRILTFQNEENRGGH